MVNASCSNGSSSSGNMALLAAIDPAKAAVAQIQQQHVENVVLNILRNPAPCSVSQVPGAQEEYCWAGYYEARPYCMKIRSLLNVLVAVKGISLHGIDSTFLLRCRDYVFNMVRDGKLAVMHKKNMEQMSPAEFEAAMITMTTSAQREANLVVVLPEAVSMDQELVANCMHRDRKIVMALHDMILLMLPPCALDAIELSKVRAVFITSLQQNMCAVLEEYYPLTTYPSIPRYLFVPPELFCPTPSALFDRLIQRLQASCSIVIIPSLFSRYAIVVISFAAMCIVLT
jgi:hypothetical protein